MSDVQTTQTLFLGTAIKITSILSEPNPDSILITIKDPGNTEKVSNASMTESADKVHVYTWQSSTTNDIAGCYLVTIKVTKGAYTSVQQYVFELINQDSWSKHNGLF